MSSIIPITIQEYRAIFEKAQETHLHSDEPIPEYNDASIKKLEYLLDNPFKTSFGKVLYWGFYKKASILFYTMIKNHPLANGNKRMACYSLAFFYEKNNRSFNISENDMYELSHIVARSQSTDFDDVLILIKNTLKKYE